MYEAYRNNFSNCQFIRLCYFVRKILYYEFSKLPVIYVDLHFTVRRNAAIVGETDAIQVDEWPAVTSRHAHFVISWATVDGTCANEKMCEQYGKNTLQSHSLLVCSVGHAASRDTKAGTLFVRSINDVFREHAKKKHILTLMTQVI